MNGYPVSFRTLLHLTVLALVVTGLLLTPGALEMRLEWSMPWSLDGGQRVWAAASHALSFFLILLLIGALWTVHMRAGWLRRENILSGAALLGGFALLAISGLGLYYAGDESLGRIALTGHLIAGLGMPVLLAIHIIGAVHAQTRIKRRST